MKRKAALSAVLGMMGLEVSFSFSISPFHIIGANYHLFRHLQGTRTALRASTVSAASFECLASDNANAKDAVEELFSDDLLTDDDAESVAFLFVGPYHSSKFAEIVEQASELMDENTNLIGVLGGGVVGGGCEVDNAKTPSMALLRGTLPDGSQARLFQHAEDGGPSMKEEWKDLHKQKPDSYLVFPDPFARTQEILDFLDSTNVATSPVIAGGVSIPQSVGQPSLAINGKLLPPGSVVGMAFSGNIGLQAVVSQGCCPVGPVFNVTGGQGNRLTELSGKSAIAALEQVAAEAEKSDRELIRNGQILCGIHPMESEGTDDSTSEDDFLIRQIMGFQPKSGSILVGGKVRQGDTFRFHVWAKQAAREDMDLMIQRAKTERLVMARGGKPLAAFQFSCIARGKSLFGVPNVDIEKVKTLLDGNQEAPVAGFFANGEIGPVGIRMTPLESKSSTYLHSFTTVAAVLCDYSDVSSPMLEATESPLINDANAWA